MAKLVLQNENVTATAKLALHGMPMPPGAPSQTNDTENGMGSGQFAHKGLITGPFSVSLVWDAPLSQQQGLWRLISMYCYFS